MATRLAMAGILSIAIFMLSVTPAVWAAPADYDTNANGTIEKDEVIAAIRDFFAGRITKDEVIELIRYYFSGATVAPVEPEPTAELGGLSLTHGDPAETLMLSPPFSSADLAYTASVGYEVVQVTVTATGSDGAASAFVQEDGITAQPDADSGTEGHQVALTPGENVIRVAATAGDASQIYIITVTRAKPTVNISAGRAAADEGTALLFTVTRSPVASDALEVTMNVAETGGAIDPGSEGIKTVTIAADAPSVLHTLPTAADDALWNPHSTVTVTLEPGAAYTVGSDSFAETQVRDDDFPQATAVLTVDPNPVPEGGSVTVTVTVTTDSDHRPNAGGGAITVSTSDGTATQPDDYASLTQIHNIALTDFSPVEVAGNARYQATYTSMITVMDDTDSESGEAFTVSMTKTNADTITLASPSVVPIVISESADATLSVAELVKKVRASVVRIESADSTGSGVIFDTDDQTGFVATNYHVVRLDEQVTVTVGDETAYDGAVLGIDALQDLAVVRICCGDFTASEFGDDAALEVGTDVVAMGYALGLSGAATVTTGIVSAVREEEPWGKIIQTDAPINPGNSGGPLFTLDGLVVGINTFVILSDFGSEGLGFAVAASIVQQRIPDLLLGKSRVPEDRDVLESLYNTTDGDNWINNDNWMTTAPLSDWYGVATDGDGRVTHLGLEGNQLRGGIPWQLGHLSNLESLALYENQLSRRIPSQLGSLSNLVYLGLYENELSGEIPAQLGGLSNLERLSLSGNQLSGRIPSELGNLANLEGLWLYENQLSGEIPPQLGSLSNLESLALYENQLSGEIPSQLGSLSNLIYLGLHENQLSGEIPPQLGSLSNLESLALYENQLSGEIPSQLGSLSNLIYLGLHENQLSGEIPPQLGSLSNLESLALYGNQLSGRIPSELGNLANLTSLFLSLNELSGEIPSELGSLSNLESLALYGNQLSGRIPSELGNLANLTSLFLSLNELSGEIPSELGDLANLKSLFLSLNELSGEIPSELGNLASLTVLDLSYNELSGAIPSGLGNLAALESLWLAGNELTGCIPVGLRDVPSHDLDLLELPYC